MMDRSLAIAAVWRCRRCRALNTGASMALADSSGREVTGAKLGELSVTGDTPKMATLDERLLRCPACGSSGVEIPAEILDAKYLP